MYVMLLLPKGDTEIYDIYNPHKTPHIRQCCGVLTLTPVY